MPEQGQQGFYNWQPDQDDATEVIQHTPHGSSRRLNLPSQPLPSSPLSESQKLRAYVPRASQNYQEPVHDMGSSLGYGQGMEYQYFDAPQPSQPIEVLRQERLQQLREERMRRQQRRIDPGASAYVPWVERSSTPRSASLTPTEKTIPWPPAGAPSGAVPPAGAQSLPPAFPASTLNTATAGVTSAAAPAQDTAAIQRVRIGKATLVLTLAFVASRVLGLLRTSMFAFVFGTSTTSDAYLQAFLIPDLIFNIVAGGALSSAFIPVFTKYMVGEKDEKTAWHVTSSALNLALVIMMTLALIVILLANQLVPLYNPGIHDADELNLIANLTRIMLLQSILLGGGVVINAVLNARQDFRLPAIGTVLYNVGLIVGLLPGIYFAITGHRHDATNIAVYSATVGVVLGAILQVGIQIPGLIRERMQYTFSFDWRHPGVIQIGVQMLPRIFNAAMLYMSTFVDRSLLLLLVAVVGVKGIQGLITQYYQALQLVLLPLGIFGMAVSTAAFPTLAENVTKGRFDRVRNTIQETLRSILFLSIPSSMGLIVLGLPIIQVLLQHGSFNLKSASATAVPLAFFSIGLAGLAAVEILTRSFYAMRDSKTPVIISVGQFIFKIALSLVLINFATFGEASGTGGQWGMGALALSTSIAGLFEAAILFWLLHQRIGGLQVRATCLFIGKVLVATAAMGLGLLILRFILDHILVTTNEPALGLLGTSFAIIKLLIELFAGLIIYIRGARFLGIEEMGPVKRVLNRLKLSWI